jgi:sulfonate transport system substrate-binding protein
MAAARVLDGAPFRIVWSEFPSAQTLLEALSAGAVDVGVAGDAPFFFAYANDPKLKVVQIYQSNSGGRSVALVAPKTSNYTSIGDLKGRKIATGKGSIGHYLVLRLLEEAHLRPSDVQFKFLSPGDAKAALASGAVDAWATWGSYISLERLSGAGRVVADGTGVLQSYGFEAANDATITSKRPQLEDFLKRLAKAERWEQSHADEYSVALAKETGLPQPVALDTIKYLRPEPVEITKAIIDEERGVLRRFVEAGVIKAVPPIDGAFDQSFNDTVR